MASIKTLKKEINKTCYDVIDECFSFELYNPGKKDKEIEKLIDSAVDLRNELIEKMNNIPEKAKMKDHYADIRDKLENESIKFINQLNKLSA